MTPRTIFLYAVSLATLLAIGASVVVFVVSDRVVSASPDAEAIASVQEPHAEFDVSLPTLDEMVRTGPQVARIEANFYTDTTKKLQRDGISFIEVNLTSMEIIAYENGARLFSVPVKTKGRPGSWWQTPAGVYRIQTKKEKHFSSFGQVYTDWNLPFQGNFFIHGWPYHEGGSPVPAGYSGGCIRLTDEDAKKLYEFGVVDMPVVVYEEYFASDNFTYEPVPLDVTASSYFAMDIQSNTVLLEQQATSTYAVASIAKIMTALIAAEYLNLDKSLTASSIAAAATTTKPRFTAGQSVLAFHLLYPLLNESSNQAAAIFAESIGTKRYVRLMNDKAVAIGMQHTTFTDPAGILADNTATAEDLARLAQYLYYNRPFILNLLAGRLNPGAFDAPVFEDLSNYNLFTDDTAFVGGKVGHTTAAAETMLAVFTVPVRGTERPIAIIVLGSTSIKKDIQKIRAHLEVQYK